MKRLTLLLAALAQPALADADGYHGYDHMMGWGYGGGLGMIFGPVLWLIVLGLIVAGVIWLVRRLETQSPAASSDNSALAELDMRLARGEIDAEDYAARKKLLTS
ncbi:SHOCT domain-containing protein [Pseudodonghicola flavimaris]|uniref:SHOCT domain-containing protein n=1 Tax=Pseudodonghicola flavimaris TaxID=3050036 RepID=A0ABT7F1Z1_9RHOB|nr:SHOCT domain-containing protein [Pseudodonghicola flavimaris]MDK3018621.1 SHOCT domain-containing protein [Pseudodonghicola flavimaris]